MTTLPFTLPPIVERELRVASRRSATYWGRAGAAASGIIIVFWVLAVQLAAPKAMAGQITFRLLAGIAAFTAVANVLQSSSDAFAREKREDTIGLLFLTPLKPIDLVVGKLVSTSLAAFYRFLAIIPLLAIPMLLGGVTAGNFALLVLGLVNTVFLGATIGLYISARSWDEKRAGSMATAAMFCLAFLPLLAVPLAAGTRAPWIASLFAISPAYPIWEATFPRASHSFLFWASLLWAQALGWILFFATCRALPRCWQNRPLSVVPVGEHLQTRSEPGEATATADRFPTAGAGRERTNRIIRRSVRRRSSAHERTRMLERNPIFWLAMRWRPPSTVAWIIGSFGLIAVTVAIITGKPRVVISPGVALFACFCVNAGFKLSASTFASLAFARDHGEDRLELLLSTPITPSEMIRGHVLALSQMMRPWIRRALWLEAIWLAITIFLKWEQNGRATILCIIAALAVVGFLVPDLHAVGWEALWRGVIARKSRDAAQEANQHVLMLPWLPCALVWVFVQGLAGPFHAIIAVIVSWTIFSVAANWWFATRARHNLERQLVLWAQRRSAGEFEHYDGWRHIGRRLGRWWRARSA